MRTTLKYSILTMLFYVFKILQNIQDEKVSIKAYALAGGSRLCINAASFKVWRMEKNDLKYWLVAVSFPHLAIEDSLCIVYIHIIYCTYKIYVIKSYLKLLSCNFSVVCVIVKQSMRHCDCCPLGLVEIRMVTSRS